MANVKISIHNRNLEVRKKAIKDWKIDKEDKKDLVKFLDDLGLGKVNKGKKIGAARQLKYLDMLKIPLTFFNKPTSKLTIKDVERFEKALSSNKLKNRKQEPLSPATKVDIRRMLRAYLTWKLGENKARELTYFFDTRVPAKTPDYLTEQEIEKLYKACKSAKERYLVAVLFDSGARAEEFHNIRCEDIQLPKDNEAFVKVTIKEEYSKTEGRTISLYWKYSLEAVRDYLEEREKEGIKSDEPVFKDSYDNARQFLYRLGKKVLGKRVHYHLFRHSSATFYATKLNRQQLCYRYGWKFSSNMPDVYISRSGMESKELDEKFKATELEELRRKFENDKLKFDMKLKEQEKTIKENQKKIKELVKLLLRAEKILQYKDLLVEESSKRLDLMLEKVKKKPKS